MICHHCREVINCVEISLYCSIRLHQTKPTAINKAAVLNFHMECFEEIAGEDYLNDLRAASITNITTLVQGLISPGNLAIKNSKLGE